MAALLWPLLRSIVHSGSKKPSELETANSDDGESEMFWLNAFCSSFQLERSFTRQEDAHKFEELLKTIVEQRIANGWISQRSCDHHMLSLMKGLRLLLRDDKLLCLFVKMDGMVSIAASFTALSDDHLTGVDVPHLVETLREQSSVCQKVSVKEEWRSILLDQEIHIVLSQLLQSTDLCLLQCCLCCFLHLCKTDTCRAKLEGVRLVGQLLYIVQEYDAATQRLAADVLSLLVRNDHFREQLKLMDTVVVCLRLLGGSDVHLLQRVVAILEHLGSDQEMNEDIRLAGGIPILLNFLQNVEALNVSQSSSTESKQQRPQQQQQIHSSAHDVKQKRDQVQYLQSSCCSTLTQLVVSDASAQAVVQANGVFILANYIRPHPSRFAGKSSFNLQCHALRALRFLFSLERNRQLFKRLFLPDTFEMFIDIGHYQWNIGSYNALASTINSLPESELDIFLSRIDSLNRQRAPMFTVGKYHVIELLGSGAFGSVYKVKRKGMDQFYAMKEIKITHPFMGKTQHEREKSMGRLLNEVTMVKEQLRHPNVVRYYKTFKENFHLYIVMELLEGAPLSEHVSSLVEKGRRFSEEQIWKLFVQLILALRYIHKEKHISHRDLSAANVMIGDDLKLTITDFGLAKQKEQDLSVMNSVVGTMPYWSPELVQSDPYTEKVDIWAAGCLLYLMAMLHPPFKAANPLALATKIVEGSYPPLPDGLYSPQLSTVIGACLTKDPSERPDCVAVGALVAAILMKEVDGLKDQVEAVKRKYEKEKEKSHKHQQEAIRARRTSERIKSASRSLQSSFAASVFEEDPLIDLEEEPENILNQSNDGPQQRVIGGDSVSSSAEQSTTTTTTSVGNSLHSFSSPPVVLHGVNHLVVRPTTSTISMTTPTSVTTTSSTRQMESASRTRSYSANESDEWSSPDVVHRRNFSSVSTVSSLGYSRERGGRSRKGSAGLVAMSPNRLKEINDPILQFLTEIHKLVCVTQVPPPATPTMRYQIVQLYKRSLFGKHSKPADLKRELHKLSSESLDPVDYFLPARTDRMSPHARLVSLALQELYQLPSLTIPVSATSSETLNYQQLKAILESVYQEILENTSRM